jgi:glycosyltransferase involved in cell wall biosynthesis
MRVAIDARQLWELGIGTYVRNLLGGLARAGGPELDLTLLLPPRPWRDTWSDPVAAGAGFPGADAAASAAPPPSPVAAPAVRSLEISAPKQSVKEHIAIPVRLFWQRLDLVHAPHYVAPLAVRQPLVITVHDTIHLLFPEFLSPARRRIAGHLLELALRRARRVIAVSRRTADDLEHLFPFTRSKLRVIYPGLAFRYAAGAPDPSRVESWRRRRGLPDRYYLAVGAIRPHKNLLHLARAYAASGLAPGLGLVLAGEAPLRFALLKEEIAAAAGSGVRFLGRVADADLPLLYAGATGVAVPSLYEGFGLTALEAMAMGVPVLAAATGSLPEVVGEAGLLLPPHDLAGWSEALARVARDQVLRSELGARGRERAPSFSLERLGAETLAVYREAARG